MILTGIRRQNKPLNRAPFFWGIPCPEITATWPYQIINALLNVIPDTKYISKKSMLLIENKRILSTMRKLVHEGIAVSLSPLLLLGLHGNLHWVTEYMQIFYWYVQYPWSYKGFWPWSWKYSDSWKKPSWIFMHKMYLLIIRNNKSWEEQRQTFSPSCHIIFFPQINSTLCSNASDRGQLYWVVIKLDSHLSTSICISFSILFLIQG